MEETNNKIPVANLEDNKPSTSSNLKVEHLKCNEDCEEAIEKDQNALQYFDCSICSLREKYEYFGKEPPFFKNYRLLEEAYVIEDPFLPPKNGKIIIVGSHCVKCNKMVCKSGNCSIYFNGTCCISCAKHCSSEFPNVVQEKINRIIL